jgi:hypothetical protein
MENLEVILGKTEGVDAGLDELMVTLVPIKDAVDELTRPMHLIGQL